MPESQDPNVCVRCQGWKPKDRPYCRQCVPPAELREMLRHRPVLRARIKPEDLAAEKAAAIVPPDAVPVPSAPPRSPHVPAWGLEHAMFDMSVWMGVVFCVVGFGGFIGMWIAGWFWPWILLVGVLGVLAIQRGIADRRRRAAARQTRALRRKRLGRRRPQDGRR